MKSLTRRSRVPSSQSKIICAPVTASPFFSARSYTLEGQNAMMRWFVQHGMTPQVLDHLEFPTHKPGAILYIDDRGYHFRGIFPSVSYIEDFRPWNKQ